MVDKYTRGADIMRLIVSAESVVKSQLSDLQRRLAELGKSTEEDVRQKGEKLLELAEHYLPAIDQSAINNTFAEIRIDLKNVLHAKQQHEQQLQSEWDQVLDRRHTLQDQLSTITEELNGLVEQRENLEQQLADRLTDHTRYQQLSQQALAAEQELERNEDRVEESRREAAEKLPAYEKSRLFKYLVDRDYGTSKYTKRGLTRRLDRWVARLVNFEKAKKGYDFLNVTPELMAAEVERRRSEFNGLMESVEEIQQAISEEIGLTNTLKEGMRVGKQRDATLAKIEAEQDELNQLDQKLEKLASEDNEFYDKAVAKVRKFLDSMHQSHLESVTRSTPEQTDDQIFAEIKWLNERMTRARQDMSALQDQQHGLHRNMTDMADLARRFRMAEFDSRRSVFPAGFDPRRDIDSLLRGEISPERVWEQIRRHQRFLPTWVEERWEDGRDIMDSDFSYVLMRVLAEAAGAAIRHAANNRGGYSGRSRSRGRSRRSRSRPPSVRRRARGGFTSGRGF